MGLSQGGLKYRFFSGYRSKEQDFYQAAANANITAMDLLAMINKQATDTQTLLDIQSTIAQLSTKYWLQDEVYDLPSILAGGNTTVTVLWRTKPPTTDYVVTGAISNSVTSTLLGKVTVEPILDSRTLDSIQFKIVNTGLLALSSGAKLLVTGGRGYRPPA